MITPSDHTPHDQRCEGGRLSDTIEPRDQLVPQAMRLLEHIRALSEQYAETLQRDDPELDRCLQDCARVLNERFGNNHSHPAA